MKLECTIGSISCNGVLAEKGDVFEIDDVSGKHLIEHGNAVEPIDTVVEDVPTDEGVQGVSRHDGTQIVKPQKTRRKK